MGSNVCLLCLVALQLADVCCHSAAVAAACRVSAHFVEQPSSNKPTTTILIKFDASVMQRQAALDAAKRG
jgi:hypothetical protein